MTCCVGSSHSGHRPAKFVDLVPCGTEGKIFLICHVTTQLKCHVTLWMDSPYPKPSPSKFGVHTLYESRNITFSICLVTTMST